MLNGSCGWSPPRPPHADFCSYEVASEYQKTTTCSLLDRDTSSKASASDYFIQALKQPIKKVLLSYGADGRSLGIAQITFVRPNGAADAAKALDGTSIDKGRQKLKVEILVGAKDAAASAPPKGLSDRLAKPKPATKAQPRTAAKPAANSTTTTTGGRGNKPRARNARSKPKTAEELDAEMQDYFDVNAAVTNGDASGPTSNGIIQSTAESGKAAAEDEIM
ncbi:RNA-binding RNA annealing protein [Elasticomyces elasticus]|nr:RNA-binding RNA annealing protein [Elasticomyces elasticus]